VFIAIEIALGLYFDMCRNESKLKVRVASNDGGGVQQCIWVQLRFEVFPVVSPCRLYMYRGPIE